MALLNAYLRQPITYWEVNQSPVASQAGNDTWIVERTYLIYAEDLYDFLYNVIGDAWVAITNQGTDINRDLYSVTRLLPHTHDEPSPIAGEEPYHFYAAEILGVDYVGVHTLPAVVGNELPERDATYCKIKVLYNKRTYPTANRNVVEEADLGNQPITGVAETADEGPWVVSPRFVSKFNAPQYEKAFSPVSSYRWVIDNGAGQLVQGKPSGAPQTALVRTYEEIWIWHMVPAATHKLALACLGACDGGTSRFMDYSYKKWRHLSGNFLYDIVFKFRKKPKDATTIQQQLRFRPNVIHNGIALPAEWATPTNELNERLYDEVSLRRLFTFTLPIN